MIVATYELVAPPNRYKFIEHRDAHGRWFEAITTPANLVHIQHLNTDGERFNDWVADTIATWLRTGFPHD